MVKYYVREGKNPKTGAAMFFGQIDKTNPTLIEDLAEEISHATTATEADIRAVIAEMQVVMIRHLQSGESLRLGMIGSFCPTMQSTAARLPEEFTEANIKRIGVAFRPTSTMKYSLSAGNPKVKFQRLVEEE